MKYILLMVFLTGCSLEVEFANTSTSTVSKGKSVYQAHCTGCHNTNPKLQGAIGPDLYGSSRELLEKKVIFGLYPNNYKPKRQSNIMPQFPYLKDYLSEIERYLNE